MIRSLSACGLCVGMLIACEQRRMDDVSTTRNEAKAVAADNALKNQRDVEGNKPTPIDQGNGEAEVEVTRLIRQEVLAQPNFSVNAQNVKIITQKDAVTLRGPVENSTEKATIERIARSQAGVNQVVSELEVKVEDNHGKE
jgi:osmotically-inducible protein OsmY